MAPIRPLRWSQILLLVGAVVAGLAMVLLAIVGYVRFLRGERKRRR